MERKKIEAKFDEYRSSTVELEIKERRIIEMKNEAESLVYNTEKQLKENDSKIGQDIKDTIRADINGVNEAVSSDNHENLKECLEKLRNSAMEMGKAIYQNASNQNQQK